MEYTANLYGLVKAASYQKEPEEKKKSWFSRHPLLTALGLAGAGYGGYKYISSGEAAEDLAGIKNWIGESALGQSSFGKSLGLDKWVDFDHNRLDTSKFGPGHVPGAPSESFADKIRSGTKMDVDSPSVISQKTGMGMDEAKKYIADVRSNRERAVSKLMGHNNPMPASRIRLYGTPSDMAKDVTRQMKLNKDEAKSLAKNINGAGPATMVPSIVRTGRGSEIQAVISLPKYKEFDTPDDFASTANAKINGMYNKNVKGDMAKLHSRAQSLGHEESHALNWNSPSDNPENNYRLDSVDRDGTSTARKTFNKSVETQAMKDLVASMENKEWHDSDYTYPLYSSKETSQSLASMKQLAIALNGGRVPRSKAGWRKAFEYIANSDPQTAEQYRFQSYITPQRATSHTAEIYKQQNIKKVLEALLKEDSHGVSAIDQLAFRPGN